jgi:hypothetical protein
LSADSYLNSSQFGVSPAHLNKAIMFSPGRLSPKSRNLLLGATFVLLLMLTLPHYLATTQGAYKLAVATAHQSPPFTEALGMPVSEAWFSEGRGQWGNPASAEMLIPVRGQLRKGKLRVRAIKDGGSWRLTELTLELREPDEHVDLLAKTPL